MKNLFNFILKHYFVFLFLLLETLALLMVVRTHDHQRTLFLHSANTLSGLYYQKINNVSRYLSLNRVNQQLAKENEVLLERSHHAFLPKESGEFVQKDTMHIRQFRFMNAEVINNSVIHRNNFITLNKGRNDGIEKDMGVITHEGVVGIVRNVSPNFSSVISMLHKDMQISVRLLHSDHIGTLSWEGGDYRMAIMSYIPTHVDLNPGDTVVTSGFSRIFPRGIPIGTIVDHEVRRGENFFTANLQLFLDFNRLRHVYVVNDLMGQELEILESQNQ